jgi:hypothetical protein
VNGDGYPDLLIGAPGTSVLGVQPQGRVYVIFGGPNIQSMDLSNFENGTQANAPGSGFLIKGPLVSTSINVGLGHPAPVPFGAQLATRRQGDTPTVGDVNGDGLDDIVIGASGDSSSLRLGGGTVWVIYGKNDGGTVDLGATTGETQGANRLLPSTNTGFRLYGADLLDEAGQSTALAGSINGNGDGSIVITAPGMQNPQAPNLLAPAGAAYVIFGGNYSGDLDLASLNQTGGPSGYRIYGPAAANIASTAPVGDVDGDGLPDILIGGNNAAWVLAGKTDTNDVYLNSTYTGYQISGPDSTYGPAQVAGVGDVDGDGSPDTLISFPQANSGNGSSFLVYGRPTLTNVNLGQNFDASSGTRIDGGTGYQAGTSADGIDGDSSPDTNANVVMGAPGANAVMAASASNLQYVSSTSAGKQTSCQGSPFWPYPYPALHGKMLPVCRKAKNGTVDRTLKYGPYKATVSAFHQGNARFFGYDLNGNVEASHAIVPVIDSLGNHIASISWQNTGCFEVYDSTGKSLGYSNPTTEAVTTDCTATGGQMQINTAGRACMKDSSLDHIVPNNTGNAYTVPGFPPSQGWVHFEFVLDSTAGQHYFEGLEGFIPFSAIANGVRLGGGNTTEHNYTTGQNLTNLNAAYTSCGVPKQGLGQYQQARTKTANAALLDRQMDFTGDNFPGHNFPQMPSIPYTDGAEYFRDSKGTPLPLSRNQGLDGVTTDKFLFNSTTAVQGGDIIRAMLPPNTPFTEWDYMTYTDPNVPAGQCRLIKWVFGEARPPGGNVMVGWMPFRNAVGTNCPTPPGP